MKLRKTKGVSSQFMYSVIDQSSETKRESNHRFPKKRVPISGSRIDVIQML